MSCGRLILAGLLLASAFSLRAVTTNDAATAEFEGRSLALQLRDLRPIQNLTNAGTLKFRGGKTRRAEVSLQVITLVTETNWQAIYRASTTNTPATFSVTHTPGRTNEYRLESCTEVKQEAQFKLPFAGSDFWLLDLGAEFFHWPAQRLLKKEIKKGQSCDVLESRPAQVAAAGYSRVVAWIDRDTGGIVQAEAYDAKGKLLKEFEVKEFSKVNGEWRVTELEMRNVQAKTSSLLLFAYEK
jgi:Outer membrane lipoprotein-sorting protein